MVTSSESESEAATPLGTPTSEKKNFDRNDLIERYGEEIFQNNKNKKIEQDPQEDEGVDVTMRGKSTPTYPNPCSATTSGVDIACKGKCPCPCKGLGCPSPLDLCWCKAKQDPVCGVDGRTYCNPCSIERVNVAVACKGNCPCAQKG